MFKPAANRKLNDAMTHEIDWSECVRVLGADKYGAIRVSIAGNFWQHNLDAEWSRLADLEKRIKQHCTILPTDPKVDPKVGEQYAP